jgi:nickel-dependent lactate racemase
MHRIAWGEEEHEIEAPGISLTSLEPPGAEFAQDARAAIRHALRRPLGCPPLREAARGVRSVAVMVPGKDRVAAVGDCLPVLLDELNAAGVPDEAVTAFLATGTHVKHTPAEAAVLLGPEAADRIRWVQHDCDGLAGLRSVGTTSRGNEVLINAAVLDADLKVLTGRIIPHYFAGFGGGRKALIPGVASTETIKRNHRLTLATDRGIHPRVKPCSLRGNPVHLDMLEGARLVGPAFVLNTVLDTGHRLTAAFAGELEAAHEAGCAEAERLHKVTARAPFDAVITSAGGAPYDCNFMQALKALFDVQEVVRPGGAVLCAAQCPQGMKEGFRRWARLASDDELERAVRARYDLTGHNSIMLRRLLRCRSWGSCPSTRSPRGWSGCAGRPAVSDGAWCRLPT